ncbi:MAG TPA: beta-ketoacyl-[acyl-carrier-protein] synthase family protein [Candidatus Omnitrophota bacterium]|nr:beta-ketoacyl-[acyl-carrier-protein] synthase family protein [Candidatus Omnitrophota bacterium]HRZ14791.1 beta-ketoacyl-[acyl-carrier-protein] synthase family protein [Candidatus Omnitrophota bacterium]
MNAQPVITGIGVIAPNGIGKENYWKALREGTSGIRPISVFETAFFKAHTAGEIADFEAERFLGSKGLRNMDRSTRLLCSATKLAIDDAGLQIGENNTDDVGVTTATTLSVIFNISQFTKDAAQEGPQYVNPAMFPGTTINSPSSQLAIRFGIKGFNATVSTGYSASLDALKYSVDMIKSGRSKAVLVAAVESLFFQTFVGFYKLEFLAGIKGEELSCPFDKRRNGIILGEGSCVLVVEDEEFARSRGATIYARVAAVESFFDPFRSGKYNPKAVGLKRSISEAMQNARLAPEKLDYICATANSVVHQDAIETAVIKEVFGAQAARIPVSATKSMLGETVSASGLLQIAAGIGSIQQGFIPPTINYREIDPVCDLDYVPNQARQKKINTVLVNNFGPGGNNAAAIISR